jgi:hypothetical protein
MTEETTHAHRPLDVQVNAMVRSGLRLRRLGSAAPGLPGAVDLDVLAVDLVRGGQERKIKLLGEQHG